MNSELYHHGIKGQKWGVRNGPPYPLDDSPRTRNGRKKTNSHAKLKKIAKIAAITAVSAAAIYVGYQLYKNIGKSAPIGAIVPSNESKNTVEKILTTFGNETATAVNNVENSSYEDIIAKSNSLINKDVNDIEFINKKCAEYDKFNLFDKNYWESLSIDKKGAVRYYTDNHFEEMNSILRGDDLSKFSKEKLDNAKIANDRLFEALNSAHISKDISVERGINKDGLLKAFPGIDPVKLESANDMIGQTFTEPGFFSSTTSSSTAER